MYVTTDHITAYEVTAGPLAGNYRYSAPALRSETIINADHAGNVSYYVREGSKTGTAWQSVRVNEGSATTSGSGKGKHGKRGCQCIRRRRAVRMGGYPEKSEGRDGELSLAFSRKISSPSTILKCGSGKHTS